MTDHTVEVLQDKIPYIPFGTVFLFIGICLCGIVLMRRANGGKFLIWLALWSAIEGTEYLFGSLADLKLLPRWLLISLPYIFNVTSFAVIVIALRAFLGLSQDKLRLFFRGAIAVGLVIAAAGIALYLSTGSVSKVMPFNHLLAAISLTVLTVVVAVPNLNRRFLVLPNNPTVISLGILVFDVEALYGNLALPFGVPTPPEILDPMGFAFLLLCFGYASVQSLKLKSQTARMA